MKRVFLLISASLCLASTLPAQTPAGTPSALAEPLHDKVNAAIDKGLGYLTKQQNPEGYWTSGDYPGLTGLIVQSFLRAPDGKHAKDEAAQKGLAFIRKNARPDGGIYAGRLGNYNTSICLTTLLIAGEAKDSAIIDAARDFLVNAQTKNAANPANNGGFGYESGGSGRQSRPDLDNTVFVLEALRQYRDSHREKEIPPGKDLNWQAALDFVSRCQQLPAQNKEPAAGDSSGDKGGFAYTPVESGDQGTADANALRGYGTMTYAGVLSFVYADLKKNDPRVTAAFDWISRHYTLEENPGQGAQGLYYYYHLMAKGLTAAGVKQLRGSDGKDINWRADLASKLIALQQANGSWSSENGRWMEKDPNLVTAYCLLALDLLQRE